jgi:Phytanoyl-CoA dioxygenase (PhyH)
MTDWFNEIGSDFSLSREALSRYSEFGFVVMPGPCMGSALRPIAAAYDRALSMANVNEVAIGTSTTRLHDLVNRGAEFDSLYVYGPLLAACHHTIGRPFQLSSMLARTLRPYTTAQALHADVKTQYGYTGTIGFIFMIDEFRADNGATRFVPGSHRWTHTRCEDLPNPTADFEGQELAIGVAGSLVIYDGAHC